MSKPDRKTAERIRDALTAKGFTNVDVASDDPQEVALVRSTARRVAREHGWKVRTIAVKLDNLSMRVHIIVIEAGPLQRQLWDAKSDQALRRAMRDS